MNILWFDHAPRVGRYDKWLYLEFAKKLNTDGNKVFFYAPAMHEKEPDYTPIPYHNTITLEDLVTRLNIDIVIVNTKSAMHENYFPKTVYPERTDEGKCWLPRDFAIYDIPKICIEEDYHYEYTDKWYEDMGFKVLLQRHYSQYLRKMYVPVKFFPFSVDTDVFKPDVRQRTPKVAMAGVNTTSVYPYRQLAMDTLYEDNLIDVFVAKQKVGGDYVDCLKQYMVCLSGGSRYQITPAKKRLATSKT